MRKLVLAVTICILTFSINVFAQDMIIDSNGNIGMGVLNPDHGLHIAGINEAIHIEGEAELDQYSGGRLTFGDIGYTYIEETTDDLLKFKAGEVIFDAAVHGFGVSDPSAKLDVFDTYGYYQLRLRTSFTPSETIDSKGTIGTIAWDNNYVYIKTSAGWKRAALSTW